MSLIRKPVAHRAAGFAFVLGVLCVVPPGAHAFNLGSLNGSNGLTVYGADVFDGSGRGLSFVGDINGDGQDDLAIGSTGSAGVGNFGSARGEVALIFGKVGLFSSSINLSSLSSPDGVILYGPADDDVLGAPILGNADFNGDGQADLVIGAGATGSVSGDDLKFYVLFGPVTTSVDLTTLDGTDGFIASGGVSAASSYPHVAAADLNADGYDDLAIACRFASDPGEGCYVLFGKSAAFSASVDLHSLGASDGFVLEIPAQVRNVSAGGDWNGDGLADLCISDSSNAYVVFGSTTAFPALLDVADLDGTDGTALQSSVSELAGHGVAFDGDINGDGFADAVVGAPGNDGPTNVIPSQGVAYIVFGNDAGTATFSFSALDGSNGFKVYGKGSHTEAGYVVEHAGDFNGDGFGDFLIGSPGLDQDAFPLPSGEDYMIFGKASGFATTIMLASLSASAGTVFPVNDSGDNLGNHYSLAGRGDLNGDGLNDIALGAHYASGESNASTRAGDSYVVFGGTAASSATYKRYIATGNAPNTPIGFSRTPDSRCWIDYDAGDDGSGEASLQTVTLTRSDSGVSGELNPSTTANVVWEISSNRVAWSSVRVTLHYTDAEIAGLTEANLAIYKSESLSGPWTQLTTNAALDTTRNMIAAAVLGFSYFAIADTALVPVELDAFAIE